MTAHLSRPILDTLPPELLDRLHLLQHDETDEGD